MAYADSVDRFLKPVVPFAATDAGVMKEIDIGGSSGTHGEVLCVRSCYVNQVAFLVTGEAVTGSTTAPTVVFKKRPTPNSATSESTIATLTVPSGTAIGKVIYKRFDPVALAVGDTVQISWTVGVGGPTGMGVWDIRVEEDPETPANNSDLIASA